MRRLVPLFVLSLGLTGCAVNQLRLDQDKIRCALLGLYTEQLMDNLVRAANGKPIIILDYGTAQATITAKNTATTSDSYALTHTNMLSTATSTFTATRLAVYTFMGALSHDNTNIVSVTATPLTTSVEAYNAYLQFLAVPGSLQVGPAPPLPGTAHICRRYGKDYYWVPVEFKELFFDLAQATTSERGRLLLPPPEFYTVRIQELVKVIDPPNGVEVRIDREIPNDIGRVEFSNGRRLRLNDYRPEGGVRLFETDHIVMYLESKDPPLGLATPEDLAAALAEGPITVRVYLDSHRPSPPTRSQLLDMIPFSPGSSPPEAPPADKR